MKSSAGLKRELEEQELGTHMCCIYRDKEEQLSALTSFMSLGIDRNEKCLYVVDERTKEEVIEFFKDRDFDVEEFIEKGQFEFLTKNESYLRNGYFEPDRMIGLLEDYLKKVLKEGYSGLRLTGEMTWFFSDIPGVERIMDYESKLNEFLPDSKVIALCQYNENKFPADMMINVLHTHPKVLLYDDIHQNPYFMPPEIFNAQLRGEVTPEHYEGMKKDIIERTKLKREREESKRKLKRERDRAQKYLETADVMMVTIDHEGEVIQANRKASEVLGYEKEEIIGKNWFDNFIPEEDREELKEIHKNVGRDEYPEYHENPVLTESGKERDIMWHNSFLEDEEGQIIGTLSSGMDITEQKETRERKNFLNTLIKQDLSDKTNILTGYLQLLEKTDLTEEQEMYLKRALRVSKESDEILRMAKELNVIEDTDWTTENDIIKVLEHIKDDISSLVPKEDFEIYVDSFDDQIKVQSDYSLKILISQIIKTRIDTSDCSRIKIELDDIGDKIVVSIHDNGEELPKEIIKLFSGDLYRGNSAGIGGARYYMIREIAEHNNTGIEVADSELGGARFDLSLVKA